ncbi:serine/threonine-protein kinase MRCK alpha-like isoform X1 [Biomphalaria glabrata]|uniref:Serine/threonine-protein kinase MRCK alpha-like isoform X1 n=2 Tax=Biomphalaria glabrata TaxID=6526 RepID=A0A9W2ZKP6_BIOGL|nr:serine/threonine-protein kinase MRCK alpha-like isoform X1 [Biomphalaria glabrata]
MMTTPKQSKTIAAQLEVLDEFKQELDKAGTRMDYIIKRGNNWLEDTKNETFMDINTFLVNETSECLRRFATITNAKDVNQTIGHENLDVGTLIDSRSITIKSLQEKNKRHEKQYKQVAMRFEEIDNKNYQKFDQITNELYLASNFMASLQESYELLSFQVNENAKQIKDLTNIRDQHTNFDLKLIEQEEKCESLLRLQKSVEHKLLSKIEQIVSQQDSTSEHVNKTSSECEAMSRTVNSMISSFDHLNSNLESLEENVKHIDKTFKETENTNSREFENLSRRIQSLAKTIGSWQSGSFNLGLEETQKELKDMALNLDSLKKNVSDLANRQRNLVSRAALNQLGQLQKQKTDEIELKMSDLDKKNIEVGGQVSKLATDIVSLRRQGYQYFQEESQKMLAFLTTLTAKKKPENSKEEREDNQTGLRQGEIIAGDMSLKLEDICSELKALTDCFMYIQEEIETLKSKINQHEEIISQF